MKDTLKKIILLVLGFSELYDTISKWYHDLAKKPTVVELVSTQGFVFVLFILLFIF